MTTCISQPISWLQLELFALGQAAARDAEIASHLAACRVCARCLEELRGDVVTLPPVVVPDLQRVRRRWWIAPAMAFAAAAAIVIVLVRRDNAPIRDDVASIKGAGEVTLGVVRERAGIIRDDVTTFAAGDRWKVVVTCAPASQIWIDVAVVDAGTTDYPLAPARMACGNRVVVPGAFTITGSRKNLVCARLDATALPVRTPPRPGDPNVACVTLVPE